MPGAPGTPPAPAAATRDGVHLVAQYDCTDFDAGYRLCIDVDGLMGETTSDAGVTRYDFRGTTCFILTRDWRPVSRGCLEVASQAWQEDGVLHEESARVGMEFDDPETGGCLVYYRSRFANGSLQFDPDGSICWTN